MSCPQRFQVGKLLESPGEAPAVGPVEILLQAGRIEAITPLPDSIGDHRQLLALPALVNAHDHGRGLAPFTYGAFDQALELWLPALKLKPELSVYALTALALAKLARSGVGSVVHCHNPSGGDLLTEARSVCQAARDVGVRLALALPLCDRNALAYGDSQRLLNLLAPEDRKRVGAIWNPPPLSSQAQVEQVHDVARHCEGDLINVQYCPTGPQWCSPALLKTIAAASAATGRRIHTHLLETRYQREWADAHYPQGLIQYLDDIDFLSPRLTVAHGTWLRSDELDILAARGVIISVNTSSNLRLRSGIAPYQQMLKAGVAVTFGLDGMSLHDDEDAFKELRLNYHLYAQPGVHQNPTPAEVFSAHRHGITAVNSCVEGGRLKPGYPADFAVLNYAAMTKDMVPDICDAADVVLARGAVHQVESLWVAGNQIVANGKVLGIDEAALTADICAAVQVQAKRVYSLQPLTQRYQRALQQFYAQGLHRATERQ